MTSHLQNDPDCTDCQANQCQVERQSQPELDKDSFLHQPLEE